jgi:ubiquinone/menaquinone biosynthesis C-methylase UbiE
MIIKLEIFIIKKLKENMSKSLDKIHQDVPADHYDKGIKKNIFQRYWHYRRFNEVLRLLKPISGPALDIGCHSGTFTKKVLSKIKTQKIYGIDISPLAISLAKKRIPYGKFKVADAIKLPFKDNYFEAIICLEVLEHIDNPMLVLKEMKRVLKKNGIAILLVPTDNSLFKIIWFLWTLRYSVWRHAHVQSFSSDRLEKKLKKMDFKIEKVKRFNLNMLKIIIIKKDY